MNELEDKFHDAMLDLYRVAKKECGYDAKVFLDMVLTDGGVKTARKLLGDRTIQYGFRKLWECERLNLTVECLVLNRRFATLFNERELEEARRRLRAHDFDPAECEPVSGRQNDA